MGKQNEVVVLSRLPGTRWEDYRDIRLEALRSEPVAFGSSYEEEAAREKGVWEDRIRNIFFALRNDDPIGLIGYTCREREKQKHIAEIFSLFVRMDYRRTGIGEKLLKQALSSIRENEAITKVSLCVNSPQICAVNLYKKYGFEVVGKLKNEIKVNDKFYDQLLMEIIF